MRKQDLCVWMLAAAPIFGQAQPEDEWNRITRDGQAAEARGDFFRAAALYRDAVRVADHLAPTDARRAWSWNSLGMAEDALGNFADGEAAFRRALAMLPGGEGLAATARATVLANLSGLYLDSGRPTRAEPILLEAIALHESADPADPLRHAAARNALAECFVLLGRFSDAEALLTVAVRETDPETAAVALNNLGVVRLGQKRLPEALRILQDSVAGLEKVHGAEHPALLRALNNLGAAQARSHKDADAEATFRRTLSLAEKFLGEENPLYAQILENYAGYLRTTGQKDRSRDIAKRAAEILRGNARRNGIGATVDVSAFR